MRANGIKWMLLVVVGLMFSFSSLAFAQGQGRRMDIDTRVGFLKEKLSLSEKQASEVKKILVAQQEEAQKDREQAKGNFEEVRKNRQSRAQETDKKINALLDDKQKDEYKKIVQEREQRWQNRPQ